MRWPWAARPFSARAWGSVRRKGDSGRGIRQARRSRVRIRLCGAHRGQGIHRPRPTQPRCPQASALAAALASAGASGVAQLALPAWAQVIAACTLIPDTAAAAAGCRCRSVPGARAAPQGGLPGPPASPGLACSSLAATVRTFPPYSWSSQSPHPTPSSPPHTPHGNPSLWPPPGGGCGVGLGLGWGFGGAWGSKYIIVDPEFAGSSSQQSKPRWFSQLQQQLRIAKFEAAHQEHR